VVDEATQPDYELGYGPPDEDVRLVTHHGGGIITTNDDPTDDPTDVGFGAAIRRYITSGVYNGDFWIPPSPDPDADVDPSSVTGDDANRLPYWSFVQASGRAITARSVADSSAPSGRAVRFTMAAGATGDEGYLEQVAAVASSRAQSHAYRVETHWVDGSGGGSTFLALQFVRSDGVTPTGSGVTTSVMATDVGTSREYAMTAGIVPTDAAFLRIRAGFRRSPSAATTTGQAVLAEVRMIVGSEIILTDLTNPSRTPGRIYQENGILYLDPDVDFIPDGSTSMDGMRLYGGYFGFGGLMRVGGSSFPTAPYTPSLGDTFFRTDRGIAYYYDGTRWLCTCQHVVPIAGAVDALAPITVTSTVAARGVAGLNGVYDAWVEGIQFWGFVVTTNDAANYWTLDARRAPGAVSMASWNTSAIAANTHSGTYVTVGALLGSTIRSWDLLVTKTGAPGGVYPGASVVYRLVG
jgi:hypothetical protein